MALANIHPRESTFNLRIDADLKEEFTAVVEAEERPAAEVLRSLFATTGVDITALLARQAGQPSPAAAGLGGKEVRP